MLNARISTRAALVACAIAALPSCSPAADTSSGTSGGTSQVVLQEAASPRTLTVTGEGFVLAKPDMASVTVGVTSQADTAAAALADNTAKMSAVMDAIKGAGIEERDVQTANFSVNPNYAQPDPAKPSEPSKIVGYTVSNDLTVRVRDLSKLGAALDTFVTSAGANTLYGINFEFAEPAPFLDDARKRAIADAKAKAKLMAEAAGVTLGPIQTISESGSSTPMPMMSKVYAMDGARSAVPIAAGESRISANVMIIFAIE